MYKRNSTYAQLKKEKSNMASVFDTQAAIFTSAGA